MIQIGTTRNGKALVTSVHGLGLAGIESLLADFHAEGGKGGEAWARKYPFHSGLEGDDFSKWCAVKGIVIAKSRDGAWAIPVVAGTEGHDASGYPLAAGAQKVRWFE